MIGKHACIYQRFRTVECKKQQICGRRRHVSLPIRKIALNWRYLQGLCVVADAERVGSSSEAGCASALPATMAQAV